jgi:O-antigen ligase
MGGLDRTNLARIADGLLVAVAVTLPWSTSLTSILLVLWLLALIPAFEWLDLRRELMTPAGGLPVLLVLLGLFGMAWADVTMLERWKGFDGFIKLLIIPLLMVQVRRSGNGKPILIGFIAACVALLVASWVVWLWPSIPRGSAETGVAVKSYIVQSAEFTMCVACLLYLAVGEARKGRIANLLGLLVLSAALLQDIFFVATSRTTLVVIPALLLLYGARQFGWKGFIGASTAALIIAGAILTASPYVRGRVTGIFLETKNYERHNMVTSSGERIIFWSKSLRFVADAPIFGHGTGSITEMFRRAATGVSRPATGESDITAEVPTNPHNQTFAVAIQIGLIGAVVLWAMWISHLLLFRGGGLAAWIGLIVVVQNIIGSLFNSFLFDFTEGWLYVIGVGVAAGIVLRQRDVAVQKA